MSASRFSYQSPIFDTSAELGWSDEFFDTLKSDPPKLIGVLTERANICDRDRMTEFLDSHGYKLVLVTDDIYMYVREVS